MRGTYKFIQNGEVIAEQSNLITTAGKKALLEFVAGYTKKLVGSLVVGIGTTAANVADRKLVFEVARQPTTVSGVDYLTGDVIFRTQLSPTDEVSIYEVGAHSMGIESSGSSSQLLLGFNAERDAWSAGTWVSTNSRIGSALQVSAGVSATADSTLSGIEMDLSEYSDLDQFVLAYRANTANTSSITVYFQTDPSNHYSWTIASPSNGVYAIASTTKGAMTKTGSADWSNITSIRVRVVSTGGGASTVDFDGLRVEDVDANREESVLVSRAVLGSPIVKTVGLPLDIEYAITL